MIEKSNLTKKILLRRLEAFALAALAVFGTYRWQDREANRQEVAIETCVQGNDWKIPPSFGQKFFHAVDSTFFKLGYPISQNNVQLEDGHVTLTYITDGQNIPISFPQSATTRYDVTEYKVATDSTQHSEIRRGYVDHEKGPKLTTNNWVWYAPSAYGAQYSQPPAYIVNCVHQIMGMAPR